MKRSPVIAVLSILLASFSALVVSQPDSEVVKIVEKNRTTELMAGSVFQVHFASGGSEQFNYVTHKEKYCSNHSDASGCPPEEFSERPTFMQNFSFTKNSTAPVIYRPNESICFEDGAYIQCDGLQRIEVSFSKFLQ